MDAIHLAWAIEWVAELFVTADQRQFTAVQNAGLAAHLV
jgi:hypothetical protein